MTSARELFEAAMRELETAVRFACNGIKPTDDEAAGFKLALQAARRAEGADKLHDAIMNLPCTVDDGERLLPHSQDVWVDGYRDGFRDARHAAAELAAAQGEVEKNAARYLWLRNKANSALGRAPMVCMVNYEPFHKGELIEADELDAAIDAAIGIGGSHG